MNRLIVLLLAAIIGAATAYLVYVYKNALSFIFDNTVGMSSGFMLVFYVAFGGLITGIWLYITNTTQKSDISTISAFVSSIDKTDLSIKQQISNVLGSIFTVGFGGSSGPETPSAQIGSVVSLLLKPIACLSQDDMKILVACGVASGISAAFNAPLSGFVFVIEVIYKTLPRYALGSIMLSSVVSASIIEVLLGSSPAFKTPNFNLESHYYLPLYFIMGIFIALVAKQFHFLLSFLQVFFSKLKIPFWCKPIIGAICVGVLGLLVSKDILGTGYSSIEKIIQGDVTYFLIALLFAKLFATSLTLGSGGKGGIVAPSLFLGATFGGAFGIFVCSFISDISISSFSIVGMGAMLAGMGLAPILGIVLPFELTRDYNVILPLAICIAGVVAIGYKTSQE